MIAEYEVEKERIIVNAVDGRIIEHEGQVACDECDWTWAITSDVVAEAVKVRDNHPITIKLTVQLFDARRLTVGEAGWMETDDLRRRHG